MIRITAEEGQPTCIADLSGRIAVYLDNDSLIELSKATDGRRERFLLAIRTGGSLLFSFTNAIEVAGPQGDSSTAVRGFLDSIGPCWIPLELNPWKVAERETAGDGPQAAVSETFMTAYFKDRAYELSPEGSQILDLSADTFFRLSSVVDWAQTHRDELAEQASNVDSQLVERVSAERAAYESDPKSLDTSLPAIAFDARRPATFALIHLLRILVIHAKAFQFKKHDGLDLCHAVLGASQAHLATLDKQWRERVGKIPGPHQLAEIYYRPQSGDLVTRLETLVGS